MVVCMVMAGKIPVRACKVLPAVRADSQQLHQALQEAQSHGISHPPWPASPDKPAIEACRTAHWAKLRQPSFIRARLTKESSLLLWPLVTRSVCRI